ncbi:MAG: sialate O-acetylesterase [Planctomycetaceae bacterium]|nr:sialate O-acetylesterase [Planctomycetaceae bacterium]
MVCGLARSLIRAGAVALGLIAAAGGSTTFADVKVPNIFTDHMVLQQGQKNRVWGSADAGETVKVTFGGQSHTATPGADGKWTVTLDALPVNATPQTLTIAGKNTIKIEDVLVGEVWICSGQSNMQWSVNSSTDSDLEKLSAKFPKIRMINFPQIGKQESIWSHDDRKWQVCAPETVGGWSAVGYFFAKQLHQTLDVPVGMINNAWGGSAAEAWVNRDLLAKTEEFKPLMDRWEQQEKAFEELSLKADLGEDQKKQLGNLKGQMGGNHRPGNIYNGVLKSHLGYGIRGAIWYQGESNAGRAYQYRNLFPLMIKNWRDEWGQGDFPFYYVQLADFLAEKPEPGDSSWAELREAQTMTMDKLPNVGEAVIIDIGEGKDIHPKNKLDVGKRLARWALAKDYGVQVPYKSPRYKSMVKNGNKITLTFDNLDGGFRPFDVNEPRGFAIAGADKKFVWARAKFTDDKKKTEVEVWSDAVADPASVRYAWADNPVCNMYSNAGLPLTPFRTDDWPGVTINSK